jgi:hypothetical protein
MLNLCLFNCNNTGVVEEVASLNIFESALADGKEEEVKKVTKLANHLRRSLKTTKKSSKMEE